ncbi:MAG: FKBP-type peptidyl-prolyl cis-trans isomerase [Chloroflexi bacterium]|nr:FKBP-type peptidyl-prolyl cis-trans isomerase [Chloroflexota bacterium]MDA1173472.1 FKBP-type peptidyl-prolyl cis-trans isomerase [Chloroflexota bacterium]
MALSLLTLLVAACGSDPTPTAVPTATPAPAATGVAKAGDSVAVHYHGTLDDGTVFDSSLERTPLEFVVGSGQLIAGFDKAVDGLAVGESVTVRIPPAEAYGELDAAAPVPVDLELLPPTIAEGDSMELGDGSIARIVSIDGQTAMVVINHALAGQALTFEITLVEIK